MSLFIYAEAKVEEVPAEWRADRISEALCADLEKVLFTHSIARLMELLDSISAASPALGAHLRTLAQRYDMDEIKAALAEISRR